MLPMSDIITIVFINTFITSHSQLKCENQTYIKMRLFDIGNGASEREIERKERKREHEEWDGWNGYLPNL